MATPFFDKELGECERIAAVVEMEEGFAMDVCFKPYKFEAP